jgi:hypothetical protein
LGREGEIQLFPQFAEILVKSAKSLSNLKIAIFAKKVAICRGLWAKNRCQDFRAKTFLLFAAQYLVCHICPFVIFFYARAGK